MHTSEFADEYEDWLNGAPAHHPARWLRLTLGEMRHTPPLLVPPDATAEEVIGHMNAQHESAALVVSNGRLVGIFTERDVLSRVVTRIDGLFCPVHELMTERPEVLDESTLLSVALRRLALGHCHHLPVLDDKDQPVGVVSLRSILSYLVDTFPNEILNAPPARESYPPCAEGA